MAEIVIAEVEKDGKALETEILAILDQAAVEAGKPFVETPLCLRATDGEGNLLGGLFAQDLQGWIYVKLLAVTPQARGLGVGGTLMREVEAVARRRGHVGVYVDTFDFQAPDFYTKLGYDEIGRLPGVNDLPIRIWYAKIF